MSDAKMFVKSLMTELSGLNALLLLTDMKDDHDRLISGMMNIFCTSITARCFGDKDLADLQIDLLAKHMRKAIRSRCDATHEGISPEVLAARARMLAEQTSKLKEAIRDIDKELVGADGVA